MEDRTKQAEHVVIEFETMGGRIFQIPIEVFPGYWGCAYLVWLNGASETPYRVLIDSGSGIGNSNLGLEEGFKHVSAALGQQVGLGDLTHIFITHAHIDHFGGLAYVRPRTSARIGIHELDRRVLTNYEERLVVVSRRLSEFLVEAGVPMEQQVRILESYMMTKSLFHSVKVDFTYEAEGMELGPFRFLHVPGHCAGQVVIRLGDILFSGDHVLEHTSPHQAPEQLTLSTGLDHYLQSLEILRGWAKGIRLTLGGHEKPISDLESRIDEIHELHAKRLDKVLDILSVPGTVNEVSHELFGEVHGYNVLLALEEAGAHVEYLYLRGLLGINNLAELEGSSKEKPIRYCRS